jgi:hypothetical protein
MEGEARFYDKMFELAAVTEEFSSEALGQGFGYFDHTGGFGDVPADNSEKNSFYVHGAPP